MGSIFSWAAIVASLTFVAACYKQIKGIILSFSDLFIEKHIVNNETRYIVVNYLVRNFKLMSPNSKSYYHDSFRIMSTNENRIVAFKFITKPKLLFRKGLRFLIVGTADKNEWCDITVNYTVRTPIYFMRFLFNFEDILKKAVAEYEKIRAENAVSTKITRFAIHRVYGTCKDGGLGGIISMLNSKDSGKEPAAIGHVGEHSSYAGDKLLIAARSQRGYPISYTLDDLQNTSITNVDPFEVFPYPPEIMLSVEEAREWKRSEKWYLEKHIPWRRGYVITGEPGVGKTLFIKSLAQSLDMPVYLFDLASMNNQELYEKWDQSCADAPCLVVLEDFDNVFHGRTNVCGDSGSKVSFDALLNCISGIKQTNGIFLVITANDITKLDSAIGLPSPETGQSSRPGRIDKIIHMGHMDEECRRKLAARLLEQPPYSEAVDEMVARGEGLTGAQFSEICNQESLRRYWDNKTVQLASLQEQSCR